MRYLSLFLVLTLTACADTLTAPTSGLMAASASVSSVPSIEAGKLGAVACVPQTLPDTNTVGIGPRLPRVPADTIKANGGRDSTVKIPCPIMIAPRGPIPTPVGITIRKF